MIIGISNRYNWSFDFT